ncbi:MAG TPA: hypothetical protein VM782_20495, partial [Stellaceae bacterium]|nr:hypothetical protein [Stellaceae bacterium]
QYLAGFRDEYPEMPANYFPEDVAREMAAFREIAVRQRDDALFERFPVLPAIKAPWQGAAVGLFASWFAQLEARRSRHFGWLPFSGAPARGFNPTYA